MCPDPFGYMIKIVSILTYGWLFVIGMEYGADVGVFLIAGWTFVIMVCYYFAPRHCVVCGISGFLPSRYEEMVHIETPEESELKEQSRVRWKNALEDLKEKGAIDKNRTLHDLMPEIFKKE